MRRLAPRKDANHGEIVRVLRAYGASVYSVDATDFPDLVVGFRKQTFLLEVKTAKGKLKPGQEVFFKTWRGGPAKVVRTPEEAIAILLQAALPPAT